MRQRRVHFGFWISSKAWTDEISRGIGIVSLPREKFRRVLRTGCDGHRTVPEGCIPGRMVEDPRTSERIADLVGCREEEYMHEALCDDFQAGCRADGGAIAFRTGFFGKHPISVQINWFPF